MLLTLNGQTIKIPSIPKFMVFGTLLTFGGPLVFFGFPSACNGGIQTFFSLKEGGLITKFWSDTGLIIDAPASIYFWNLDNPEDWINGKKAKISQKGPYTWLFRLKRTDVVFNKERKTVRYYDTVKIRFDRSQSVGPLSDKLTIVNLPFYIATATTYGIIESTPYLSFLSFVLKPIVLSFLDIFFRSHGETLVKTLTLDELLHRGYKFNILDTADRIMRLLALFGIEIPEYKQIKEMFPGNRLGFFQVVNVSKIGPSEVYTEYDGTHRTMEFYSFMGKRTLDAYDEGSKCNILDDSGGLPACGLSESSVFSFYAGYSCRTFQLVYNSRSMVLGIPTYRFTLPGFLASNDKYPENTCFSSQFCRKPENYNKCDGINWNLGACAKQFLPPESNFLLDFIMNMGVDMVKDNVPVSISFPHLWGASKWIQESVEGVHPEEYDFSLYIDIEPNLGLPLRVNGGGQMNIMIKPIPYVEEMGNLREAVLPFIWGGGVCVGH